jgi:coenzyme PQQ biosynthesis protein C
VEGMLNGYAFISPDSLSYFSKRPPLAERDSEFALDYIKRHAQSSEAQQSAIKALEFKCDVLWTMLDVLYHAYVAPKHVPPGAFVPRE